jgi:hypothetical protein
MKTDVARVAAQVDQEICSLPRKLRAPVAAMSATAVAPGSAPKPSAKAPLGAVFTSKASAMAAPAGLAGTGTRRGRFAGPTAPRARGRPYISMASEKGEKRRRRPLLHRLLQRRLLPRRRHPWLGKEAAEAAPSEPLGRDLAASLPELRPVFRRAINSRDALSY